MSNDSSRFTLAIVLVAAFALTVIGAVWLLLGAFLAPKESKQESRPEPPPVRSTRSRGIKVYGPIVRAPVRARPVKARASVRERPKPYVPPRYRVVFRRTPPMVPPGAPKFPSLTNKKFYTLDRKKFNEWANLPIAKMGARFTPDFHFGTLRGIKVAGLDDHSFYNRMGLYREDIIEKINGRQVVAPGQARKFFQTIGRRYRNVTIQFRRGGKVRTVDFSLK